MNKPKFLKGQCDLFAFVPSNWAERFKGPALRRGERQARRGGGRVEEGWTELNLMFGKLISCHYRLKVVTVKSFMRDHTAAVQSVHAVQF